MTRQVVGLAQESLRLQDVGNVGDGLLERGDGVPVGSVAGDEDERLEGPG